MRGAPQVGFSVTSCKITSLIFWDSFFLPTRPLTLEINLQYRRNPPRCQRTTASGFTSMRDCFQAPQKRRANTQKILSTAPIGQLLPESEIFQKQASLRLQAAGEQAQQ